MPKKRMRSGNNIESRFGLSTHMQWEDKYFSFACKIQDIKKTSTTEEDCFTQIIKAIVEHFPPSTIQRRFIDSSFQTIYLKYKRITERKEQPLQSIRSGFLRELLHLLESYLIGDEGIKQVSSIMSCMSGFDQDELILSDDLDLDELCVELGRSIEF